MSAQPRAESRATAPAPDPEASGEAPASARDRATAARRLRAKAHFERGLELYQAGEYRLAIRQFQTADALMPSPAFRYNIGRAHEELGELEAAIEAFEAYLQAAPEAEDAPAVAERVAWLKESKAALRPPEQEPEPQGALRLLLPPAASGLRIELDGEEMPAAPEDGLLTLTPGSHRLEVARSSGPGFAAVVQVRPGELTDAHVRFAERLPPRDAPKAPDRTWPVVLGIIGGTALVTGTGFAIASRASDDEALVAGAQTGWIGGVAVLSAAVVMAAMQ